MEVSASLAQFKAGHKLQWLGIGRRKEGLKNDPASSDAQLAERLKQRDEHAFLNLYELHRISVYRFLMHMTGSTATAEELTQEVFVVILDSMCAGTGGQFDPERGTWEGYLLGIARNLARAERRRTGRLVDLGSIVENPDWERLANALFQENRNWDIAAQMAERSELTVLHRAILELPDHYREAVVLCSLQEKSYRDAAAILQCSEGTVASRMNRAKAILAAKLRKSAPNKSDELAILRGKEGTDVGTAIKANGN
ncbi:MAG TPA: RNA polymerase sigma factor [Terracidiphilus sp.]|jgi:RNA polymerase sigma-70 factor (ECF subfamily)|nr:RNA polymerase sigma factor [Terracidiphilus sp.]